MNAENIINQIENNLQGWFYEQGFKLYNPNFSLYIKNTNERVDCIGFDTEICDSEIKVGIGFFSRKFNLIESYWDEYAGNLIEVSSLIPVTISGSDKKLYHTANWEEEGSGLVEKLCNKVKSDYYTIILPKLNEYSDIRKLNDIANGDDRTFSLGNSERYFRKLIIAKLAGDSRYDLIFNELIKMYNNCIQEEPLDDYYKNILFVIEQIHEKMKNIEPLGNTILV